jgi:hypothetical protein
VPWNGSIRVPVTPFEPQISSVDDLLTNDDRYRLRSLRLHLDNHRGYYWRAILLAEDPSDRAQRLAGPTPRRRAAA